MAQALDDAWIDYRHLQLAPARKAEAIGRAFKEHPAAGQVKRKRTAA
jgi:hypothetical protein